MTELEAEWGLQVGRAACAAGPSPSSERLGRQLRELGLPVDEQIANRGLNPRTSRTLAEAWKTPPAAGAAHPSGAEKARRLAAIPAFAGTGNS